MTAFLASTSDKLQVVTGQVASIDMYAAYSETDTPTTSSSQVTSANSGAVAVVTATTTDLVAAPASGKVRNIRYVNIRNKHVSASCDITVQQIISGPLTVELIKITLAAGDSLEFAEGVGWYKITNPQNVPFTIPSTADQSIAASVTNYLTASDLHISAGRPLRAGTTLRWHVIFIKSAAATATMTFDMRVGTAGTTADTSRASLATGTQTAVADVGHLYVDCTVRSISATGTVHTGLSMEHNLAATGLGPTNVVATEVTSGTFDTTATNLIFGLSLTTGALHAITIKKVVAEILPSTI